MGGHSARDNQHPKMVRYVIKTKSGTAQPQLVLLFIKNCEHLGHLNILEKEKKSDFIFLIWFCRQCQHVIWRLTDRVCTCADTRSKDPHRHE